MEIKQFRTQWGGKELVLEVGRMAAQANAAVTARYGDTMVMAAVTMSAKAREGIDFFPLQVEYEEKLYASGKIKSSRFMKREGRPTDDAVMTGRMIDRALRPLFPQTVRHEVQVILECLSADLVNPSDMVAFAAAACALHISDVPWDGPIAGIRVGRVAGEWLVNPTFQQMSEGDVDAIVAGTDGKAIMLEVNAKEVPEAEIYDAIMFGQRHLAPVMKLIEEVRAAIGKEKADAEKLTGLDDETKARRAAVVAQAEAYVKGAYKELVAAGPLRTKPELNGAMKAMRTKMVERLKANGVADDDIVFAEQVFYVTFEHEVSMDILDNGHRIDGRASTETRPLRSEIDLLPRAHGSALFSRGETQVLSVTTLGGPGDVQLVDTMEEDSKRRYFHHYNFPPYSVGETGRIGATGRREIGHGGLAERALKPVLPEREAFPYTIRMVSEVMESNGSSSQASICGCTLALMDAGVPIKAPVAGVAMGLASDAAGRWQVITDLQAIEDGHGGMDFKVGGTRKGITTIQLDTKTDGLTPEMTKQTLAMARDGRMSILDHMASIIAEPRPELKPHAPRIETFKISVDRIRDVIGPGGKMINEIINTTGAEVDVEDDGTVTVTSANLEGLKKAVQWIKSLTREVGVGELFEEGKVVRIMDFGAFVEVAPGRDGLVHISELAPWRVGKVTDMVNIGDVIPVKVIEIDELGRINLSHKAAMKDLGREQTPPPSMGQGDRGDRGGDQGGRFGGDRGPRRDNRGGDRGHDRGPRHQGPRGGDGHQSGRGPAPTAPRPADDGLLPPLDNLIL
jgi:polyribonucleotide nucleotidyltransferase